VYWIEILKDCFNRKNLEDFKRLCWIVVILWDFKRHFLKDFLQSRFLMQDFNGFIIWIFKILKDFMDFKDFQGVNEF
jgi:hypothetical protein